MFSLDAGLTFRAGADSSVPEALGSFQSKEVQMQNCHDKLSHCRGLEPRRLLPR